MRTIERPAVKRMLDNKEATVIEVLDQDQYDKFHLPGAINIPVSGNFEAKMEERVPDKTKPVIVYCYDKDCDASPRAAKKLDRLGYREVFDYEAGKVDWKEAGLPVEA